MIPQAFGGVTRLTRAPVAAVSPRARADLGSGLGSPVTPLCSRPSAPMPRAAG